MFSTHLDQFDHLAMAKALALALVAGKGFAKLGLDLNVNSSGYFVLKS
jgi:hypothetical protein